jgi:hypothetical protein
MIECTAAVNLPRLPRGYTALVDEDDPRVKRLIRGGYLIPLDHASPDPEPEEET